MRHLAACFMMTCAFAQAAGAQEFKAWTGGTLGFTAGYNLTNLDATVTSTSLNPGNGFLVGLARAASASFEGQQEGFTGGLQSGYSWALGPMLIVGIEGDIQGLSGEVNASWARTDVPTTINLSTELNYLATLRGRVGVLLNPTLLLYGTGGLAVGWAQTQFAFTQFALVAEEEVKSSDTLVGWVAGAGVERFIQDSWSLRAEYLYYDLGDLSTSVGIRDRDVGVGAPLVPYMTTNVNVPVDGHIARIGLVFRIN